MLASEYERLFVVCLHRFVTVGVPCIISIYTDGKRNLRRETPFGDVGAKSLLRPFYTPGVGLCIGKYHT